MKIDVLDYIRQIFTVGILTVRDFSMRHFFYLKLYLKKFTHVFASADQKYFQTDINHVRSNPLMFCMCISVNFYCSFYDHTKENSKDFIH